MHSRRKMSARSAIWSGKQSSMRFQFALGSGASYMEDDVRAETDAMGFCRHHYK